MITRQTRGIQTCMLRLHDDVNKLYSVLFSSKCWLLFCFDPSIDFVVLKHCGESHISGSCTTQMHVVRALGRCSAVLEPAVWKRGALPKHTCPPDPRTARLAPITAPQCVISKWIDLYIKIQTTTYSGQVASKASAPG